MLIHLSKGVPTKLFKFFWLKIFFTLNCEYLRLNFRKTRKGPNGILSGLGETDSWKKPEVENLVALSL